MKSCAKTSSAAVKGKKQVQIPSDGPKRSLRVNKGLHPGRQCQWWFGMLGGLIRELEDRMSYIILQNILHPLLVC